MGKVKYGEIIDIKECYSILNATPATDDFMWGELLKFQYLAGENEWAKNSFYPINGLIGEILGTIKNTKWDYKVYILRIDEEFYVPISIKGIKILNEDESPNNQIKLYIERRRISWIKSAKRNNMEWAKSPTARNKIFGLDLYFNAEKIINHFINDLKIENYLAIELFLEEKRKFKN